MYQFYNTVTVFNFPFFFFLSVFKQYTFTCQKSVFEFTLLESIFAGRKFDLLSAYISRVFYLRFSLHLAEKTKKNHEKIKTEKMYTKLIFLLYFRTCISPTATSPNVIFDVLFFTQYLVCNCKNLCGLCIKSKRKTLNIRKGLITFTGLSPFLPHPRHH